MQILDSVTAQPQQYAIMPIRQAENESCSNEKHSSTLPPVQDNHFQTHP